MSELYLIVFKTDVDEEPMHFHTVGVDMDEATARLLCEKWLENEEIDAGVDEVMSYERITEVDGFNIVVGEQDRLKYLLNKEEVAGLDKEERMELRSLL